MLCPKCNSILIVVKVHEAENIKENRLCDVECVNCEEKLYYQPYDFGRILNPVKRKKKDD